MDTNPRKSGRHEKPRPRGTSRRGKFGGAIRASCGGALEQS